MSESDITTEAQRRAVAMAVQAEAMNIPLKDEIALLHRRIVLLEERLRQIQREREEAQNIHEADIQHHRKEMGLEP